MSSVEGVTGRTPHLISEESGNLDSSWTHFVLQSEEVGEASIEIDAVAGSQTENSETVTFVDNEGGVVVDLPTSGNPVAMVDNTSDISLGSFLARPTLINTTSWSTSDVVGVKTTFQPWNAFLSSTAIRKKIDNYAFLRGNLHLKVVINGTPFQYGALRLCYSPLLGFVSNKIRTNAASSIPLLIPYSQQPGFFIHPQANAGGEMKCRFFLHKNWLDITSNTETQNMGTVNLVIYSPLAVAVSGGSTSVTVRTYAWMTDVELMGSTSKLTLQGDEYGKGPVSLPASAIAAAAGALSKVPVIGRFARATQIGASAVSSIASLFGYTNVPVIEDVHMYQPANAPMLASTGIGTPVQKLTVDPKQELSIDPSFHGIGSTDELSMSYLKSKESFFGFTSWSTSDVAGEQLFNARITPFLGSFIGLTNSGSTVVGQRAYHIPLSYIGSMFTHWRGDIKIRMKLIVTKFHKGRLKISYDPRGDITSTDPAENTVYTEIIDVGERDDITFTIPYHQDLGWLRTDDSFSTNWTPGDPNAPRTGYDNGVLTVRVLNTLTAPAAGSVNVLFFASAGDNFEYANPKGSNTVDNSIPTFFALQGEEVTDVVTTPITIGSAAKEIPERYGQNFGEAILSLRTLLHRSTLTRVLSAGANAAGMYNYRTFALKRMPDTPGYDSASTLQAGRVVGTGNTSFAASYPNHIPYITGMYLGYRGSVNYALTPGLDFANSLDDIKVFRYTDTITSSLRTYCIANTSTLSTATVYQKAAAGTPWGAQQRYLSNVVDGLGGMAITSTRTNGSVTVNIPDYNNYNFSLADPIAYHIGSAADGTDIQNAVVLMKYSNSGTDTTANMDSLTMQIEAGAGPDFTCLHFLCCPTVDYLTAVPSF